MSLQAVIRIPLSGQVGALVLEATDDQDVMRLSMGETSVVVKKVDLFQAINLIAMGDTSQPKQQMGIMPRFP